MSRRETHAQWVRVDNPALLLHECNTHAAANLNSGYSKYVIVVREHYSCLYSCTPYTLRAHERRRRVHSRARGIDSFNFRVFVVVAVVVDNI